MLSRMSFASEGVVLSTRPPIDLNGVKSKHDAVGFPILSLLKELLEHVCYFLDRKALGALQMVSKQFRAVAGSNEFWEQLSKKEFGLEQMSGAMVVAQNNWKAKYRYLVAKAKRAREYPRLFSQGLVGKITPILREKEERIPPGYSFLDVYR